jgi:hypothetical protein
MTSTSILAQSQLEFAPIGAEWYFTAPYNGKCIKLTTTKDTVINGENYRTVEFRLCENNKHISNEYFRQNDDSVFYYNYVSESSHLLYNFSAKAGDTIIVHNNEFMPTNGYYDYYNYFGGSISHFIYVVDAVDSIQVSEIWLKRQKVRGVLNSPVAFPPGPSYVYERLGSSQYPFGRFNAIHMDSDYSGMLRCYSDKDIDYVNPDWNTPCNHTNNVEYLKEQLIKIYPNPVKIGYLTITANSHIELIELYNLQSELLAIYEPLGNSAIINTNGLSSGIYLISIKTEVNDRNINKKFVKE